MALIPIKPVMARAFFKLLIFEEQTVARSYKQRVASASLSPLTFSTNHFLQFGSRLNHYRSAIGPLNITLHPLSYGFGIKFTISRLFTCWSKPCLLPYPLNAASKN